MEDQLPPTDLPIQQPPELPTPSPKVNRLPVIAFSVAAVLLVGTAVLAGVLIGKNKKSSDAQSDATSISESTPQTASSERAMYPSDVVVKTPSAPESVNEDGWLTYTHDTFPDEGDWLNGSGFHLYYPASWDLTADRDEEEPGLMLTITAANGDFFKIIQGSGGGGQCLFPDHPEYETFDGMGASYSNYAEFKKNNGETWRLAELPIPHEMWSHVLCETWSADTSEYAFRDSTSIGFTVINVTTPESAAELKEILDRIEILD